MVIVYYDLFHNKIFTKENINLLGSFKKINYDSLRKYIFLICDETTTQEDINMYIKDFYKAYPYIYDIDMPF
jgi:hypothetical protein